MRAETTSLPVWKKTRASDNSGEPVLVSISIDEWQPFLYCNVTEAAISVDEDTDVGLADDDTVDEDTFNTISEGLAYTETNLLKPPRNDFKDLSVYDDHISSAPVQSKNCTKNQNYRPLDVASSGSSSCSSSGSSSPVNINATNASRKRQSSLPIDELVESSSQLIKLATTRMSSSSEPQSDPMVSSFAYKIKKIKDIRTRKMLELQIDRLINDSLLSYYDEFGFDE